MVKRNNVLIGFLLIVTNQIYAVSPLGLSLPYDLNFRGERPHQNGKIQTSLFLEKSYQTKGFDIDGKVTNVLQIYDEKQNVLGLYAGVTTDVTTAIAGGIDSKNGLYTVTGTYAAKQHTLSATYGFGSGFLVRTYVPIYSASLSNVQWKYAGDRTSFTGASLEATFKAFEEESQELFDLNVGGWSKTGVGDLAILFDFERDFPQRKPILRNVRPTVRLGITFPTGSQENHRELGSVPFGADGSVTIPFGGGMHIDLGSYFQAGFDAQFWYIWGKTKQFRIKTNFYQTDLLLPVVAYAAKEYGIVQSFSLNAALLSKDRCYSLRCYYEYIRKGEDVLTPVDSKYGYSVINDHSEDTRDTANVKMRGQKKLDEFTAHNFMIKAGYDHHYAESKGNIIPQAYIFWKNGFYGSYAHVVSTIGFQFTLDF